AGHRTGRGRPTTGRKSRCGPAAPATGPLSGSLLRVAGRERVALLVGVDRRRTRPPVAVAGETHGVLPFGGTRMCVPLHRQRADSGTDGYASAMARIREWSAAARERYGRGPHAQ